jgi:hypothetical protein
MRRRWRGAGALSLDQDELMDDARAFLDRKVKVVSTR